MIHVPNAFALVDLNDADIENAHIYIIDDDYYESIALIHMKN